MDDKSHSPGDSGLDLESNEDHGSNLVDSRLQPRLTHEPVLLDLPREPVDKTIFKSYTYTGRLVKKRNNFFFFLPSPITDLFFHLG